jgi:hypothetical protein
MRTARWVAVLVGAAASAAVGIVVDRSSHSVSDTLYEAAGPVLLIWLVVGLVLFILRSRQA